MTDTVIAVDANLDRILAVVAGVVAAHRLDNF
jgi:hypothetical protein